MADTVTETDKYPKTLTHPDLPEDQTIEVTRPGQEAIHRGAGWVAVAERQKAVADREKAEKAEKKSAGSGPGATEKS